MAHHRKNTITEKAKSEKNMLISASMSATREKRKTQFCRVITAKIQFNKLNQKQKEALKMLFVEAKWIRSQLPRPQEAGLVTDSVLLLLVTAG